MPAHQITPGSHNTSPQVTTRNAGELDGVKFGLGFNAGPDDLAWVVGSCDVECRRTGVLGKCMAPTRTKGPGRVRRFTLAIAHGGCDAARPECPLSALLLPRVRVRRRRGGRNLLKRTHAGSRPATELPQLPSPQTLVSFSCLFLMFSHDLVILYHLCRVPLVREVVSRIPPWSRQASNTEVNPRSTSRYKVLGGFSSARGRNPGCLVPSCTFVRWDLSVVFTWLSRSHLEHTES